MFNLLLTELADILLVLVSIFVDLLLHCVYFVEAKDRQVLSTRCYKRRYLLVRLWCMSPRLPYSALIHYS